MANRSPTRWLGPIAAAAILLLVVAAPAKEKPRMPSTQEAAHAPEFPPGLQWLNTAEPLRLKDLRGKIVLLDFWTYCCINCMHVIPDLRRLEKKYARELVVIGVHSAKFAAERQTANIRQAIGRYRIAHPVVNDAKQAIWERYGVRAWPTLVLIDPDGHVVGHLSGEGIYEPFDRAIGKLVQKFGAAGKLDRKPLPLRPERTGDAAGPLAFPGKVLADEGSGRLFVADSNHDRIVVASLDGKTVVHVIGGGGGLADGDFRSARFANPQGMALDAHRLYVADTDNHAIRRVDLRKRTVETIAGTGRQARWGRAGGRGKKADLNSPWDLVLHGGALYVAMAGPHQIWRMDLKTRQIGPYAGSGREGIVDGPLSDAELAQPSGLATDGKRLYFADSEVSAVRTAGLGPAGKVATIVGTGLFDYGDRDGVGTAARLQHPLGVAYHQGDLYVADTYNNKIKRITVKDSKVRTFAGTGRAGRRDGPGDQAAFDEPGGLSIAGGKLYVADTNNHRIRVVDLKTARVATLEIRR